jgi:pectin methylesterase-like acyl-CoA thioesterase
MRKLKHDCIPLIVLIIITSTQALFAVTKRPFNFVIGVNGNFKDAIAAAGKSSGDRFYLFFPDGEYDIGTLTGNSNQMTTFPVSNVSFIGQSADKTIIFNKSINEGISITSTLYFNKADNLYLQDLTILNKANWNQPSTYSQTGRHVAVMEQGNRIIYKNVKLLSTQDTYYTKGTRTYWENGEIHGTTDFICGDGDIFFNEVLLYINKVSYITAPATSTDWGYVFMNCTIDGSVDSYQLGRSWNNSPKCVFINTTMKKLPTSAAWGDPMNVVPSLFAEYNSKTASGALVDLSGRRTTYTKNGTTVRLNPILSASEAEKYTVENVLGGSDNWRPAKLTKQVSAPVVTLDGSTLKWNDDEDAMCWVVFKNDSFYKCVTIAHCDIDSKAKYTVRAANSMGGLGTSSNVIDASVTLCSLSVSVPKGHGTVTPSGGSFPKDHNITITAIPDSGWIFYEWEGDLTGNTNPVTLIMNGNKTVTANFIQDTRKYYTINLKALVGGSVKQDPEGSRLPEGTMVTFTAAAIKDWRFEYFDGDSFSSRNPYTITSLNSDLSITAHFSPYDRYVFEAENGTLKQANTESKNAGFSGTGYVNFSNNMGSSLELPVYKVYKASPVFITFSNGSETTRNLSVFVNGTKQIESIGFEPTENWTSWESKELELSLPEGGSIITLETVDGADGPNVDKLFFVPIASVKDQKPSISIHSWSYNSSEKVLYLQANGLKFIKVRVFSLNGKVILFKNFNQTSIKTGLIEVPLQNISKGIYLIQSELGRCFDSKLLYLQ